MSTTPQPNTPAAQPQPKKPLGGKVVTLIAAAALCVAVLVSTVVSIVTSSGNQAKPQQNDSQQPIGESGAAVKSDVKRDADIIRQNGENAARAIRLASDLHAQLPECNDKLRAKLNGYYTLHSNNPEFPDANLVCQPDNQWRVVPPAIGNVSPETPAQQTAERRGTANGGLSKAERLQMRRDLAFKSDPIPLHFADTDTGSPAAEKPETPAETGSEYARNQAPEPPAAGIVAPNIIVPNQPGTSTNIPGPTGPQKQEREVPLGVALSHYSGPRYPIFQGTMIEGVLENRLKGDQAGMVKVQITTPVYSQDAQHLLIPPGSVLIGECSRLDVAGEQRLVVVFHRIIMPDGWSFLLARDAKAQDQQGTTGLTGKVDRHLVSLISTAVMVGAIEGLADFTDVGSGSAVVEIQSGVSRESSSEAMHVFRSALNRPNSVTVYEGTRVRMLLMWDQALPDYRNHEVVTTIE